MSFFKAISNLCAAGVTFAITVEAADSGLLAVQVVPTSKTGKSGFSLTAKQFVATPEEFDAEFASVMIGYAFIQRSLAQQLKAVELVAEETAKAAVAAAQAKTTATAASSKASKTSKGNAAPAGLLEDGGGDWDDRGDEGAGPTADVGESAPGASEPSNVSVASASAAGFDFQL